MLPPLPAPNADTREFWDGCRRHELRVQRCGGCGAHRFPPRPSCPACASLRFAWVACAGRGRVHTWTVVHGPTLPAFAARTPYAAGVVRLDEGVFMVGQIRGCEPHAIHEGMPVVVAFDDVAGDVSLPQWRALP
jgi:uncharacterized OB-fold protein